MAWCDRLDFSRVLSFDDVVDVKLADFYVQSDRPSSELTPELGSKFF